MMMDPMTKTVVHSRDVLWLNRMYFPTKPTPGAKVLVQGLSSLTDEGVMVSDTEDDDAASISSAGKKAKREQQKSDDESVESVRSEDFDYTQADGTQLDPYQHGPLQQEHEIEFQSDDSVLRFLNDTRVFC